MGGSRGRFVVLDGIDGCGKTTQALRLVDALAADSAREPLHVREPGSTRVGERIRAILLAAHGELELGAAAETLLFTAARRQLLDELVAPALAAGRDVVCERFHPSTFAYQAVAGALDEDRVLALLATWAGEPRPAVVIVLDVELETALARRGAASDRIEAKDRAYQRRVAEGYRRYAERVPGVALVDGSGAPDVVFAAVLAEVRCAR